ncbi:MAG: hypothetical protein LKE33_00970 [Acidaminococcus sp.]|nr:hypothetical protein [Acidaminococcus sp.]MCI2100537.1 hypothetical protein [Acidaminococcus sp.]MCI2114858.1 hypothetical protein [Acidaminococcus sp.]MCI2117346.1 hypothetical protein [Acidaminococcus sp.]
MNRLHKKFGIALVLAGLMGFPFHRGEAAEITAEGDTQPAAASGTIEKTEGWSRAESRKEHESREKEKAAAAEDKKDNEIPIGNVPQKPSFKPQTREVDFTLQHGQLVSEAIGDVDGDGEAEIVDLMGSPVVDKSSFMGDMYVIVKDSENAPVKYYIRPKNLGGYDAYVTLADVTGSGAMNVVIAAPTGGSGGMVDYRILDFTGSKPEEIFTSTDNRGIQMNGVYLDGFRARLNFPSIQQEVILDLSKDKDMYETLNVFNKDGTVRLSGQRPYVQGISQLMTADTNGDGVDAVITVQKIAGVINASPLGYVRTRWEYRAGTWVPDDVNFQANLYAKPKYNAGQSVQGKSGYEIIPQEVETPAGTLEYPHFQKIDPKLAWKLNHQIEMFYRDRQKAATFGSRLHLSYDVKYAGRNYVSLLVMGLYSDHEISEPVIKSFNFNLKTGEEVPLKDLVRPYGKFWKLVTKKAEEKNITVTEKDLNGYYYDNAVFAILYGNHRELDLPEEDVLPFLLKNKLNEEFLTSQSNDEKKMKIEKNREI